MAGAVRPRDVQAITFDCYGTLIDWEGGAKQTLRELLKRHGVSADEDAFFRDWERAQWVRIHQSYACYREIVAESFLEVGRCYGLPCSEDDAAAFAAAIPHWPPFPEVPQALARLKHHYHLRLGIISNIDDDLLAGSLAQLGVDFDLQVTAEQARAYKPAVQPFQLALERLALPAKLVVHAAFGFEYDLVTASSLGFRTILVRRGRWDFPKTPVPDLIVVDLAELATAFA